MARITLISFPLNLSSSTASKQANMCNRVIRGKIKFFKATECTEVYTMVTENSICEFRAIRGPIRVICAIRGHPLPQADFKSG